LVTLTLASYRNTLRT